MRLISTLALALAVATQAGAQTDLDPSLIKGWHWRMIGPFRGGRTKAATGVPSRPSTFYIGAVNGGVWQTSDYGRTWKPIFDDQPTQSIGAIEVAPSNPDVIYVGSGEGLQRPDLSTGDGIYKSFDGGKTWQHLGLRDGQQIPKIIVDPRNPNRLFVSVLGHPYGPNSERGIYRSTNGGASFERVLFVDENTGGADVVFAPNNANTIYAAMWESRQAPWENGRFQGPGSGFYKSTDGGNTWRKITKGLPGFDADGLGRIGIAVAPSNPNRLYATVESRRAGGVYRSDDAGESWTRANGDERFYGRADDFSAITVDPKNDTTIYSANVVTWKSTDGGKTWNSFRGAPGGDDYQRLWINPTDPKTMLLVSDQGALVTVNAGETWSSWYNQPTAQFYHVTADNAFPYRLCGGQQESGSACVSSRGDDGSIGYREWHPVGLEEYGYAAPDPLNPDVVYGGKLSRYNRLTGQTQEVNPNFGSGGGAGRGGVTDYRVLRTMPVLFSPTNPRKLYFASNVVWQTVNGGQSWTQISGDLTREGWETPKSVGKYAAGPQSQVSRRGVVYALAPSPVDSNTIWAGTDDGLIHVTRNNGKTWSNVTPARLSSWMKVSVMDAGRFDASTAYAAINTLRLDDLRPHIFRTHDGGKTWTEIVTGIDSGATINAVREDPVRRGLLFAASERSVWYSLDDGDHWKSLKFNLPATSVRDIIVKDNDLAIATHGRGFWILDDISSMRQWKSAADEVTLFKPATATRVRYSMYTDTPVPPDEPMAENPPDGAVIEYYLKNDVPDVMLEILTSAGRVVRRYSSNDPLESPKDEGNWPWYWFRPPQPLSARAGLNRFVWDLHFFPPPVQSFELPISATPHNTVREPRGPWVLPGEYTARLTVNGKQYTQTFTVRIDPRVKSGNAALALQSTVSLQLFDAMQESAVRYATAAAFIDSIADRRAKASGALSDTLLAFAARFAAVAGVQNSSGGRGGRGAATPSETFATTTASMLPVYDVIQAADDQPTTQVLRAANERVAAFNALRTTWTTLTTTDLKSINARLTSAGLPPLVVVEVRRGTGVPTTIPGTGNDQ